MADPVEYEPDRVAGVPHPRHTVRLLGQQTAERAFLSAFIGDRLHHAWLITGPRGVGKATFAWRLARFLLAAPQSAETLDIADDHPVASRIAALSEPRLFLLRPGADPRTGTLRRDITVDRARALKSFLQMSSADGGRRAVIVDSADQLNVQAANAILKLLEEPPADTVFFLVSHAPARLLPTIRSRCRVLRCGPLNASDMADALKAAGLDPGGDGPVLAQLAAGSVGEAARLLQEDGPAIYADLVALFADDGIDRPRLLKLADGLAGAANAARFDALVRLIDLLLARLARQGAGIAPDAEAARGEAGMLKRFAPDAAAGRAWAQVQPQIAGRLAHGTAVNLDPSALILDTILTMDETGRAILRT
ncbi:DNA polymerase III subunit delta' [Oceaniovalibus guishaninsula]|uniref:DNA polymerase III subunit delta' n=1 Tax=Oceaniovalibus guishaninsula TaxID=1046117 RepID=UPI00058DB1C6|nr:DNA polymerase III subunit delta' [Oceaniovalibus guishaninsula]